MTALVSFVREIQFLSGKVKKYLKLISVATMHCIALSIDLYLDHNAACRMSAMS